MEERQDSASSQLVSNKLIAADKETLTVRN